MPAGCLQGPGRHGAGRAVLRALAVSTLCTTLVVLADPRPASAGIGMPGWPTLAAGAAAALVGTTVNVASGVGSVVMVGAGAVGGSLAGAGAVTVTVAELVAAEAAYALPAAGAVAAGAGVCVGTAGIACVVGGVVAAGAASYGLYRFFVGNTNGPGPNGDLRPIGPPTSGSYTNADLGPIDWNKGVPNGGQLSYSTRVPMTIRFDGVGPNQDCSNYTLQGYAASVYQSSADFGGNVCRFATDPPLVNALSLSDRFYGANQNLDGVALVKTGGSKPCALLAYVGAIPADVCGLGAPNPTPAGPPAGGGGGGAGPSRTLVTTRHCVDAGGAVQTVTASGAPYVEAANVAAVASIPACPAGSSARDTSTVVHTGDGSAPDKGVTSYHAPPEAPPGVEPKPIALVVVDYAGNTQPCDVSPSPCSGWRDRPTKDQDFRCMQGAVVLPLSDCDSIARKYDPPPVPPPGTGPDSNCNGGDFSMNPISWVVVPLKCLFLPGPRTTETLAQLQANIGNRAPLSWVGDVGGFVGGSLGGLDAGSGCFAFDVHLGKLGTFHIINSCDPADVICGAIRPLRPVLLIAGYLAFLGPLAWWAWRSYAPLSRPQG